MSATTSDGNRLAQLAAKLRGLPLQDELKHRHRIFVKAADDARLRRQELEVVLFQVRALQAIRGDSTLLSEPETKRRADARLQAKDLEQSLTSADLDQNKVSTRLDSYKRSTESLRKQVQADWKSVCEAHRARASLFGSLARRLNPDSAKRIEELSKELLPDDVPASPGAAQAALRARAELAEVVAKMNTNGPVERFLQDAIAGRGDPKAFLVPEVRAYLDAHPTLWSSLRVSLE